MQGKKAIVIGVGRMGQNHARAVQTLGMEISALVDRDEEKLNAAHDALSLKDALLVTDLQKALETKPDVALIATTAPVHDDLSIVCAQAGIKKILCEKPMAQSLAQCDEMIRACDETGTDLAINHQMRFMDQYTMAKKFLTGDDLGGLSSMTVVAGCFGLAMNGTHYIEAFRYLSDDKPKTVQAWFGNDDLPNPRGPDFRDKSGAIRIETEGGKRFYMEVSADQGHGMTFTCAAPYGHLFADELAGEMILTARLPEHRAQPMTRYGMPVKREHIPFDVAENVKPTAAVLKALMDGKNYPTGREARQAIAALVAAYVSNDDNHRPVAVDDTLPLNEIFPWA